MGEVVFCRVPAALKQALQARAGERGLSLNAAVVELVERGLAASEQERSGEKLAGRLAAGARELERTRARLAAAELELQAARAREQERGRAARALAERARHRLCACPQCRQPLRGLDLLASGHCPNCDRPLTALLVPRPQTGAPDPHEYLALLGALGGLLGLALTTSDINN